MKRAFLWATGAMLAVTMVAATSVAQPAKDEAKAEAQTEFFQPTATKSDGSVTVAGTRIDYEAVAGTIVVHPSGWDDAPQDSEAAKKNPNAEASMFYAAYFKKGVPSSARALTFLYNGGPGSSTVWLHMGAFGPKRVVTSDNTHTPAAPYRVVNNDSSLLDASDLVFVDAPGTGFGRIAGKDKEKAFYGVDPDVHAFAEFIQAFLTRYGRWNSPKYLFGESYGTPRSAALANVLQSDYSIDLNGVILLSQILNFTLDIDGPESNPGVDLPYELALPTYAATAWYHHRLPKKVKDLPSLLQEVERFAMGPYAAALAQGGSLDPATRAKVAQQLHEYTGLPVAYIVKADLRVSGGEFEKNLQGETDIDTGRLDSRFSGPTMDPLSKEAEYDPQSAAISSAYVSAFNDYVRKQLNYGQDQTYKPEISVFRHWDFKHKQPNRSFAFPGATNVMPDLAAAMKQNPNLKILVTGGYYDIATPFYQGWYEMHHLPIPDKLQANIQYHYYESGHMVYAHEPSLEKFHDDVAAFIRSTENVTSAATGTSTASASRSEDVR